MDPKASAKSKRGHSLHGRRTHLTPSAAAAKKNASSSGAQAKGGEAPRARRRPELPSNWDRYDEDEEEGDSGAIANERGEAEATSDATETETLAKSKGADYRYLIQQARTQPQPQPIAPSLSHDFTFDFLQGSSSMLSARGEMLLSLCEDDNFIVDDYDGSSNYEVSFLSMDLNALAGQLSKLKMSQRLFLEDHDLFMEEMLVSEPKENSLQPDRSASLDDCTNAGRENVSSSHISVEKIESLTSTSESTIETELDVLINSFEETKVSRGSDNSANASIDLLDKQGISTLDDVLDDLLAETSLSFNDQISGSISSKKDKLGILDESVDDLLGQAVMNVKKENRVESSVDVLPSSVPAKPVDDFDSWFDSL
ncbi:hypothetical protein LUZ61_008147 [Rhynchospora tenuis]|uniref:Uncharacterized protein n=1 Tax=Rhynchospora tenuis TaxID=198213 RepID=A0AAD6EX77_9POAL|nr:hypothetical protein LUZ61_008147 [Rhynchospora tenuis]